MNISKYVRSLSFVAIALSMQPHCSAVITPQDVINQYAHNLYPGNILSYWNCYDQIVVLKNGDFYKNRTSDIDAKLRQVGENDGKDVIFIPIEDIIGLIAEDSTYPDKTSKYMLNQYYVTNSSRLIQTTNQNPNALPQEKYKKAVEEYLNKARASNGVWNNFVNETTGIEKNLDFFQEMEEKNGTDSKKLTGAL
ncbi:MAG: hypothetical protein IJ793_03750, partial [Opitutales bacterium]|nr:hypothetical protein [Opitutales bacterium]